MSKPIVNIADLDMKLTEKGSRFASAAGRIGGVVGMEALGAQYIVVPPGKIGFPFHSHRNNEEMFIILEGEGTFRKGAEQWPVSAGDVISAVAGDASTAHQLINSGTSRSALFRDFDPERSRHLRVPGQRQVHGRIRHSGRRRHDGCRVRTARP